MVLFKVFLWFYLKYFILASLVCVLLLIDSFLKNGPECELFVYGYYPYGLFS